jgi:hypothetical protein
MQDRPGVQELLEAVRDFLLRDALPALDGRVRLHARVGANVLGLVQRELALAPASDAAELARLESLLGRSGTLAELNTELARRIRAGELGTDHAALLAVDNPEYSGLRHRV